MILLEFKLDIQFFLINIDLSLTEEKQKPKKTTSMKIIEGYSTRGPDVEYITADRYEGKEYSACHLQEKYVDSIKNLFRLPYNYEF